MSQAGRLLIFDFDGVVADSEVLSNAVLAECITELGHPTRFEDAVRLYIGVRSRDMAAAIEAEIGGPLPEGFPERLRQRTFQRFREALAPVTGVREYIAAFSNLARCIGSQSSPDHLALCLEVLGLQREFEGAVFSASSVERGKPHPDLFLLAAKTMGIPPSAAIVIEDSPNGIRAARAAGMTAIGLVAASHIGPGHRERLAAAGAHHVAGSFSEVTAITREILAAGAAL